MVVFVIYTVIQLGLINEASKNYRIFLASSVTASVRREMGRFFDSQMKNSKVHQYQYFSNVNQMV